MSIEKWLRIANQARLIGDNLLADRIMDWLVLHHEKNVIRNTELQRGNPRCSE